uniref:Ig-like domain-containing protein n=1 Tax=Acrobeloides nanus TaxID=290746 RepID=A0A914BYB0_9BILA
MESSTSLNDGSNSIDKISDNFTSIEVDSKGSLNETSMESSAKINEGSKGELVNTKIFQNNGKGTLNQEDEKNEDNGVHYNIDPSNSTDASLEESIYAKKNFTIPDFDNSEEQVNQLAYEIPQNKFAKNPWSYAPEFLKVFSDVKVPEGSKAVFDCVLLGSPRPKVLWLFNEEKLIFDNVVIEDTADLCRITIPYVKPYHYGTYTVLAENEVGRAVTSAELIPFYGNY